MSTVTFDATFPIETILRNPQIRKALRDREDAYLENIAWLDEDLAEKRHLENIAWLDEDLANKIDEDASLVTTPQYYCGERREVAPKIWHCGHGGVRHGGGAAERPGHLYYEEGLKDNTCFIHHGHESGHSNRGNTTTNQIKNFKEHAKEGDIIFTHCVKKGGLTHYGYFTGGVISKEVLGEDDSIHSHICVREWISLPEVVKGTGKHRTLYEVTPTGKNGKETKNYQNYSIPS